MKNNDPILKAPTNKRIENKGKFKSSRPKSTKEKRKKSTKGRNNFSNTQKLEPTNMSVIVSKNNQIKDIKRYPSRKRSVKSREPDFIQPPMVFDLSDHSDKSEDYIFGKPKRYSKKKRKRLLRKKNEKNHIKGGKKNLDSTEEIGEKR